jgi:RimJ/RimL family protein N-acetyltransferase
MPVSGGYRLRAVDRRDLNFLLELRGHEETSNFLGTLLFPSETSQEAWFASLQGRKDLMFFIFEMKEGNVWASIGMVRISEIDYINRSMCVGGDMAVAYRGRGLAQHMYELIMDLGFNKMNMHRLWLLVLSFNEKAIRVYNKAGFVSEGCQRKAIFKNGQYHDYFMMGILEDEYRKKK